HLEGIKVSHTKDGFQWDDNLDTILDLLREELESEASIPILRQADKYRVRETINNYKSVSKKVVDNTTNSIKENLSNEIEELRRKPLEYEVPKPLKESTNSYYKTINLSLNDFDWAIHIELSYDETVQDLIQVGDHLLPDLYANSRRNIGIRLSLVHPF